jgi:hypothetical protein
MNILGIVAVAVSAALVCKLWYNQQITSNESMLPESINQDIKHSV